MEANVEQAKRGDRDALAALVTEHYASVFRFCAHRLGEELAKDAAQETFVTMQRAIRRYQGRSSFSTWLLGIAHNQCRNLARKRRLDPTSIDVWFSSNEPSADPTEPVIGRECLRQALARLSPEHREAVLLHEIEGMRYAEIAELLGVPEGTVKSRLHNAFLLMRQTLTGGQA